jgi:hypothetical protein
VRRLVSPSMGSVGIDAEAELPMSPCARSVFPGWNRPTRTSRKSRSRRFPRNDARCAATTPLRRGSVVTDRDVLGAPGPARRDRSPTEAGALVSSGA